MSVVEVYITKYRSRKTAYTSSEATRVGSESWTLLAARSDAQLESALLQNNIDIRACKRARLSVKRGASSRDIKSEKHLWAQFRSWSDKTASYASKV